METIILTDGTLLNGHILEDGTGELIFIYLDELTIPEGVALFSDKSKVNRIVFSSHGEETIYTGYTDLWAISKEYGNCNIVMRRE